MDNIFVRAMIVIVVLINMTYGHSTKQLPNNIYGNISFAVAVPQGEFSDNVTNNGYGVDLDGGWYVFNGPLALGMTIIGAQYGRLTRNIPYSYFSSAVTLTEITQSGILVLNPYVRPTLRLGDFSFYTKLFGGYHKLSTETKIQNDDQVNNSNNENDDAPEYIARSTVASDGAFNYGFGLGLRFRLFRGRKQPDGSMNSPTLINLELKWSKGGEAEYLNAGKEGSIEFSDPADGPVTTTFYPEKSKTDLFTISIGIGF